MLEEASTFVSMSNPVSLQECIDTDDEGPREDNAAYLHRGSCLLYVINVTIDSKSRPKLSSLGDGSHQGQSNQ